MKLFWWFWFVFNLRGKIYYWIMIQYGTIFLPYQLISMGVLHNPTIDPQDRLKLGVSTVNWDKPLVRCLSLLWLVFVLNDNPPPSLHHQPPNSERLQPNWCGKPSQIWICQEVKGISWIDSIIFSLFSLIFVLLSIYHIITLLTYVHKPNV